MSCPPRALTIVDGPPKPELRWALANPDKDPHIHFATEGDPIDVHLDRMEEFADGTSFGLTGRVVSGSHKGKSFKAVYYLTEHDEQQRGAIDILDARPA
jgi:hypothetical protein